MSEPREVIQPLLDGWGEGDFSDRAGVVAPDARFSAYMPDEGDQHAVGAAEIARFMTRFLGDWQRFWYVAEDVEVVSDERVHVAGRQHGISPTGIDLSLPMHVGFEVRDGLVTQIHWNRDRETVLSRLDSD